jgi:hypothetical protein
MQSPRRMNPMKRARIPTRNGTMLRLLMMRIVIHRHGDGKTKRIMMMRMVMMRMMMMRIATRNIREERIPQERSPS